MPMNVTQKIIAEHLAGGRMGPGAEVRLQIDQTLTQDATGTMVMLELEAMGLERVVTDSVQYVDHNLLQIDFKNPDDHLFLESGCRKFGIWYSRPGNGVSHPVHMARFGVPGQTLLGSDSHTPAAGSLGMLAMGAGGLEVALAMAGEPYALEMPKVWGVRLTGSLPDWVSAKDVILEMLRRHDVDGGVGTVIEYYGPGLAGLTAMDRHVIANMGAELGATSTVFPSDEAVRRFLGQHGRENRWREIVADEDASYDRHEEIDLSTVEPLIALPSSPGNVVPVSSVAGRPIYQAYIGSSANPGLRDFAVPAMMVRGRQTPASVSFDINPTSRQLLRSLSELGLLDDLLRAGARLHQAGCNGCIGMGQAPATGRISLRTVPRNFPGRSGTREDAVYLCSPETATASALRGEITDPRTLDMEAPRFDEPSRFEADTELLVAPAAEGEKVELVKGPNIGSLPDFGPLPESLSGPVLMKVGDNISTDEILPAGTKVLPYRSNIPEISRFTFFPIDEDYYDRAMEHRGSGHFIVGGSNYGQGSSREHAALAPRFLGVQAVLARSFARIHEQNLINFGILPLSFADERSYEAIGRGDVLSMPDARESLRTGRDIRIVNETRDEEHVGRHHLTSRDIEMLLAGSVMALRRRASEDGASV